MEVSLTYKIWFCGILVLLILEVALVKRISMQTEYIAQQRAVEV